jgi:RNA polymerase sigma-70 factor (ECF subfamily)
MDDRFLTEQSAKGNKNAFRLLVLRYQRMVFSFLGKFFQVQVQEDLAQETFLRAYRHIADFDAEKGASFSTWLITIARNLAINERAKKNGGENIPAVSWICIKL